MSPGEDSLRCSFCRKERDETMKLIAGPSVYICNECVDICVDILRDMARAEKVPLGTFLPNLGKAEGSLTDFESSRRPDHQDQ